MAQLLSLSLVALTFSLSLFVQNKFVTKGREIKSFVSPPEGLQYFTLGYNDFMSSSLWLRLVQDFNYCEGGKFTGADFVKPLEIRDKIDAILQRKMHASKCHLGWVYRMLNGITDLDENFKVVYDVGATVLSVAVDDREGARRLFEKGLEKYPGDWQLNFRAGYHYLWEVQDGERAALLMRKAELNGAPRWTAALSAALYSKAGKAKIAKLILEDTLTRASLDDISRKRLSIRLKEVNKLINSKK